VRTAKTQTVEKNAYEGSLLRGHRTVWLPKCNSIRSRPGCIEPEVNFRIVHLAQAGTPLAPYREQMVEIALGPKGVFENRNIGAPRLRAPPNRGISAVPPGSPKPARVPKTPRVVGLLRKAIEWQALLESGQIVSQADIARQEGITRARVTQVMGMRRLAPEIQKHILSMPSAVRRRPFTERVLRPIANITDYHDQNLEFQKLLD